MAFLWQSFCKNLVVVGLGGICFLLNLALQWMTSMAMEEDAWVYQVLKVIFDVTFLGSFAVLVIVGTLRFIYDVVGWIRNS